MKQINWSMKGASKRVGILAGLFILVALLATGIVTWAAMLDPTGYLPIIQSPDYQPPTALALEPFSVGFTIDVTDIAHAGDERLFVLDKDGIIYIVMPDGTMLNTPFLEIEGRVKAGNWEEGLLGIAFHPEYDQNGFFFVQYTGEPNDRIVVSRFSVSSDPNVADPNSEAVLLNIGKPDEVHNGGDLAFGPDGYLYIPIGDGGPDPLPPGDPDAIEGDPFNLGQRNDDLLGNILRIDVDNDTGFAPECESSDFYHIPPDNPFVNGPGCDEVWATGLRNPWRMAFDRETGDLYIADVGEWEYEEVNLQPAGAPGGRNYGWHCYEGTLDYTTIWPSVADDCPPGLNVIFPISQYAHNEGCSITGGFVYRGNDFPSLRGHYVFADFCSGRIFLLISTSAGWERRVVALYEGKFISTCGEGVDGEIYIGMHYDPTIYKVVVP